MLLRLLIASAIFAILLAVMFNRPLAALAGPGDEVNVIVYVKEGAREKQLTRGFAAVSVAINSARVLDSLPEEDVIKEHRFSSLDGFTATVSRSAYERLKSDPNLKVFEEKFYHVMLDGSGSLLNATISSGLVYNGSNITGNTISVCVIDTGINYTHPALGGCLGSQFTGGTCAKVLSGYDYVNSDYDPMDNQGHGSHVSGIIASTDSTYRGIAPNASLIALKVCNDAAQSTCSNSHIISAIDWCIYNASRFNISVISMSLGGALYTGYCDSNSPFREFIDNATIANISVVVAAGNDGSTTQITDPACVRNSTAVGSTTKADGFSPYNRNSITDLLAPGSSITSVDYQGGFRTLSGTSMATPHVSGAIALLAHFRKLTTGLNISPNDAFLALNTTGVNLTDTGGSGIKFARINVYRALLWLDRTGPNITYEAPTPGNNSNFSSLSVFVNITGNEVLHSALLEWNNNTHIVNYSMVQNGSALLWARNHTAINLGVVTFRVWGNDSSGVWGVSANRTVNVNNTPPAIVSFLPASIIHNITEPANQTFNITFSATFSDKPGIVDWYVNGTLQAAARNTNFTFAGNYSQASRQANGTYNITAVVSDGSLSTRLNWTLTVNNTNRAPSWAAFANQTSAEDVPLSFVVSAADLDNDTLAYFVNNTFNFTINSTTGNVTFNLSNAGNFSGAFYLAINASDGLANASEFIFVNITAVNDTPALFPIGNLTVNETDFANITAVADDAESDLLNFTVNDTLRFNFTTKNQSAANFSWRTNLSDSGTYRFSVNVTDFNSSSVGFFNVTVIDRPDFDGDGIPDIYDADIDNDGSPNGQDSIIGNSSSLNSSTLPSSAINVTINGSANASRLLNDVFFVNVSNGTRQLLEFYWNFSISNLSLNFSVDVQASSASAGSILIRGLVLQPNQTKNITFDVVSGSNSVCIKDAEVSSIGEVSSGCNGANETLISCPGIAGRYNCSVANSRYRIANVSFTAAREQPASSPDTQVQGGGSSSGGGGGGGGGSSSGGSANRVSHLFAVLKAGETAVMAINRSGLAFTRLRFTAAAPLSNVNVDVESVNESMVPDKVSGVRVYQYLNVTTKLTFLDISAAAVEFRVPKAWLSEGGFKPGNAALYRYSAGSWDGMGAALSSEDGSFYYYVAELPAFSLFAVVAERPGPATVQPSQMRVNESLAAIPNATAANASREVVMPQGSEASGRVRLFLAAAVLAAVLLALLLWKRVREQERIADFLSGISRAGSRFRRERK